MSSTVAKTYRISSGVHSLIITEAEQLKTSEADVVRLALRKYFQDRQEQNRLDAVEQRITAKMDTHCQRLASLAEQILSFAQPQ